MALFVHRQTLGFGAFDNVFGLGALLVAEFPGGPVVYTATLSGGGVAAFRVGATGLAPLGEVDYPSSLDAAERPVPVLLPVDGAQVLLISGLPPAGASVSADGAITGWRSLPGYPQPLTGATVVQVDGREFVLSGTAGGLVSLEYGADALLVRGSLPGFAATAFAQTGDGQVFALSASGNAVMALGLAEDGSLSAGPVVGASDGLGWSVPEAIAAVSVAGQDFVAASGSSSITVLSHRNGSFEIADHIVDDLASRFQGLVSIDALAVSGRAFVAAGGGDDGVSLLELLPGGRLVRVQTIEDSPSLTLSNVQAVGLIVAWGQLHLVAASESEPGLSVFSRSLSSLAAPLAGGAGDDTLAGGGSDDLILGGSGADDLRGGGGDDILWDGPGQDRMTGGPGADVFVFSSDGETDLIMDFQPGFDRLDLSAFADLYSVTSLTISPTATGARLTYGTEVIEITTADGAPLMPGYLTTADVLTVTRPPLALIGQDLEGTALADVLTGAVGADRIRGGGGDDAIEGLDGGDLLAGDAGDDALAGENGPDRLSGGIGRDSLSGGEGGDLLLGGAGDDWLTGGPGNDLIVGGSDDDTLDGGEGSDILRGGSGSDRLEGGPGNDRLHGGPEADVFAFRDGFGRDIIADFDPVLPGEAVDLSAVSAATGWADLAFADTPHGALLDLGGGDTILFAGLAAGLFGADDFLF